MNAIKFFKIDFARIKIQYVYILAFSIFAFILTLEFTSPYYGLLYLVFGSIIFSTVPFTQDQMAETGFINILPGTIEERVAGRFLIAVSMVVYSTILGTAVMVAYTIMKEDTIAYAFDFIVGSCGLGILVCSLQYILFYALGRVKSMQAMSIVRMLPGFIVFFGSTLLADWLEENAGETYTWILNHTNVLAVILLALGLMFCLLGIVVSGRIVERRDFA